MLQVLLASSKAEYVQHLASSYHSAPNDLFSHLPSLSKLVSAKYPIILDSEPAPDAQQKAELFNCYFNSVFTSSEFVLPPPNQCPTATDQINHITIDPSDVHQPLLAVHTTKAHGPDDNGSVLLKACAGPLYLAIIHLFKTCMQSCSIPNEWKVHKIIPIPKGFDQSVIQNYIQISLLCILSKSWNT